MKITKNTEKNIIDITIYEDQIKENLKIGDDLSVEARKTPSLHNHYNILLLEINNLLNRKTIEYKKLYKDKWEYYSGKSTEEIYREKPFSKRIIKTDLHHYLDSDEDLCLLVQEIEELKNKIKFLEETIKQINQRTYHIKNIIDYLRFINGEN